MFGATKAAGWFGWGGLGMPTLANGEGAWDWTPTHPSSSSATHDSNCLRRRFLCVCIVAAGFRKNTPILYLIRKWYNIDNVYNLHNRMLGADNQAWTGLDVHARNGHL